MYYLIGHYIIVVIRFSGVWVYGLECDVGLGWALQPGPQPLPSTQVCPSLEGSEGIPETAGAGCDRPDLGHDDLHLRLRSLLGLALLQDQLTLGVLHPPRQL